MTITPFTNGTVKWPVVWKRFETNGQIRKSHFFQGKALDLTTRLRDERMNRLKAEIVVMKEGMESEEFWRVMGGKGPIAPATEYVDFLPLLTVSDDEEWENLAIQQHKLFRVEGVPPAPLTLHPVDTEGQHFHRKHLDSNFSHLFDTGSQLFIWNGRGAPPEVKVEMLNRAKQYLEDEHRPETVPITVCPMGVEPALFRTHFLGFFFLLAYSDCCKDLSLSTLIPPMLLRAEYRK